MTHRSRHAQQGRSLLHRISSMAPSCSQFDPSAGWGSGREGRGRGGCEGGGMVLSDSIRRREGLGKPQVINCVPTLWLHTTTRPRTDTPGWWTVSTAHSTPAHHSVERHDR